MEQPTVIPDSDFKDEMKLKKVSPDIFILNRNGLDQECPRLPGRPCSNTCPLFQMRTKAANGYVVSLGCGTAEHYVKEIIPFTPTAPKP